MAEVVEFLDSQMQKEDLNKSFMTWKYKSTTFHQPFVVENFFSNINGLIKKYLSPHIVEVIHKQMCESVFYKCEMITLENTIIFNDDQMVCISIILTKNLRFAIRLL